MTQEELIQLLAAYAASGKDANTNVDNTQDLISALLSPSLGVVGGTYDPTYAVPSAFTPVYGPYLTGALNSSTPVWRQAAQTILAGSSNRSNIIAQVAAALKVSQDEYGDTPNSEGLTYSAIADEVDKMMAEAGAVRADEAKFYDEQRKQLAENVYGRAGLPQPFAEYSIDPSMVAADPMLYAMLPQSQQAAWSEAAGRQFAEKSRVREGDYAKALNREMQAIYGKMMQEPEGAGGGYGGGGGGSWGDSSKEVDKNVEEEKYQPWGAAPQYGGGPRTPWPSAAPQQGRSKWDIQVLPSAANLEEMSARYGIAMSQEAQKQAQDKLKVERAAVESAKRNQALLDERTRMIQLADLMAARTQGRTPLGDALMQRFLGIVGA